MAVKIRDIGLRAASAFVLAPAAVAATWAGWVGRSRNTSLTLPVSI